jgi:hypothetical protein
MHTEHFVGEWGMMPLGETYVRLHYTVKPVLNGISRVQKIFPQVGKTCLKRTLY